MSTTVTRPAHWLSPEDCRLEDLLEVLATETVLADYPTAARVDQGVLIYDAGTLRDRCTDETGRREVEAELSRAFADGPGIVVVEGAFETGVVDRATAAFDGLIAAQRAAGTTAGDHFAKPGANDRVWNALEKLAVADPEAFVDYYANDVVALAATAWLGPGYQLTSQVNVVNPGGAGQTVHRDYHLGFMDPDRSASYPSHVHRLSPVLTLQGAVAQVDMPVQSGPTLYLPHSQKYPLGYLAYWLPEFQEHFLAHHVQLPLAAGDAVFFNPALFHAAGTNHTGDVRRMANLLQVSSAFGRAMETVDRDRVVRSIYPVLLSRNASGMPGAHLDNAVAAAAEGYPFPTNLDIDQPVGGIAPPTQADVVRAALAAHLPPEKAGRQLDRVAAAKRSH